jgi:hypothetical protein
MIGIKVGREEYGWAIRIGECMTSPFWSRDLAIRDATALANAIRGHGEQVSLVAEQEDGAVAATSGRASAPKGRPRPFGSTNTRPPKGDRFSAV